jgi:Ca2+-transporting ATPase
MPQVAACDDSRNDMAAEYRQSVEEVVAAQATDAAGGLTSSEARARRERDGPNRLTAECPVPAWRKFFAQFTDLLVILLLIATAISLILWLYERDSPLPYEAIAISAVVLLNAVMGYLQEERAASAIAALEQMAAPHAHVIRDGALTTIPAAEVVVGDILVVEEGDTAAADARVVESTALSMAEAALTGESLPVAKDVDTIAADVALGDRTNMLYSGTSATYGRGRAVVIATGMRTEMGRIAGMLAHVAPEHTPLQKELDYVGKLLGVIVVVIAIVMITTIIGVEHVRALSALFDVLILGVALAVAAVPEGLPAVVTAVLSIGVQRMARRKAARSRGTK